MEKINGSLATKAMLIDLSMSVWDAHKFDRKISKEVAVKHGTTEKAGRYNKNLFPFEVPSYEAIKAAQSLARTEHYRETMPWSDDGPRILPAANYMSYMDKSRARRSAFDKAVAWFLPEFPSLQEKSKNVTNSMYDPKDWPTVAEIASKFAFHIEVLPIPSAQDFRVSSLHDQEVTDIQAQIEQSVYNRVNRGIEDVWQQLYKAVAHFYEQVKGGVVKDAMIQNLRDLCDRVTRLNLTNDARLDEMQKRVASTLGAYDAEDLKKDKRRTRKQAAAEAEQIVKDLSAFMQS